MKLFESGGVYSWEPQPQSLKRRKRQPGSVCRSTKAASEDGAQKAGAGYQGGAAPGERWDLLWRPLGLPRTTYPPLQQVGSVHVLHSRDLWATHPRARHCAQVRRCPRRWIQLLVSACVLCSLFIPIVSSKPLPGTMASVSQIGLWNTWACGAKGRCRDLNSTQTVGFLRSNDPIFSKVETL